MQMYISFKLFNVENVVTLLAAELNCVMNCSPYIRGECKRLVGWHRSRVCVCACDFIYNLLCNARTWISVYPGSVRLSG